MYVLNCRQYYLYDFWLYQGNNSDRVGVKSPESIVLDFVDHLIAKSHQPYIVLADSFYTSLKLAILIHQRKLGCLFSCKRDRPATLWKPL